VLVVGVIASLLTLLSLLLGMMHGDDPSSTLMYAIAAIGASVFLAFAVEATLLAGMVKRKAESENWLGFVTGLGLSGLSGTVVALAVAAHREAGHGNVLDILGFCWSAASLFLLGVLVAYQPLIMHKRD
jgi:hypothetical protein